MPCRPPFGKGNFSVRVCTIARKMHLLNVLLIQTFICNISITMFMWMYFFLMTVLHKPLHSWNPSNTNKCFLNTLYKYFPSLAWWADAKTLMLSSQPQSAYISSTRLLSNVDLSWKTWLFFFVASVSKGFLVDKPVLLKAYAGWSWLKHSVLEEVFMLVQMLMPL